MIGDIEIQIVGDYYWEPEEQARHEKHIGYFECQFQRWLIENISSTSIVKINLYYHPESTKFSIQKISSNSDVIKHNIRRDKNFSQKYFRDLIDFK